MNKKIVFTIACLIFVFTIAIAQKRGKEDSKTVAYKFLDALEKTNYEEAKIYATDETDKMLDMLTSFSAVISDSTKMKPSIVTIISSKDDKKNSEVTYTLSNNPKEIHTIKLELVDNKWEAVMTKDDEEK